MFSVASTVAIASHHHQALTNFPEPTKTPTTNGSPENDRTEKWGWLRTPGLSYGAPLSGDNNGEAIAKSLSPPAANALACMSASTAWVCYGLFAAALGKALQARGASYPIEKASVLARAIMMGVVHLPADALTKELLNRQGIAVPTVTPDTSLLAREASKAGFTAPFAVRTWLCLLNGTNPKVIALLSWPAGFAGGWASGLAFQGKDPVAGSHTGQAQVDNNQSIKTAGEFDPEKIAPEMLARGFAGAVSAAMHHMTLRTCLKYGMPRPVAAFLAVCLGVDLGWLGTREGIAHVRARLATQGGSHMPANDQSAHPADKPPEPPEDQ